MYCGDEISAIVGDIGSYSTRFGFAGDDAPKHVLPSAAGYLAPEHRTNVKSGDAGKEKHWYLGELEAFKRRDNVEMRSPLEDGLMTNWELIEELWDYGFRRRLQVDPRETPVLAVESSWSTPKQREKLMTLLFEKFEVPMLYIAKSGVLSAFSAGRATAMVCDLGHSTASVVPVVDGYVLNKAVQRQARAGEWLTGEALVQMQARGTQIHPSYQVKKTVTAGNAVAAALDIPKTTASYHEYMQREVIQELKESYFYVPVQDKNGLVTPRAASAEECKDRPPFELPDGVRPKLSKDLLRLPDKLFESHGGPPGTDIDTPKFMALPNLVHAALACSDGDARREMTTNLILTGGTSLFKGMPERLTQEMSNLLPSSFKVKVLAATDTERRNSAWIGGSITSSLGTFQQMWISRAAYNEIGAKGVESKLAG